MQSLTDVTFEWPSISEIVKVLFLQGGANTNLVIVGTALLGFAAGITGTFAILRKRALMGDALAHSALPGLALAFIFGQLTGWYDKALVPLLIGATITGLLGILAVQALTFGSRLSEDATIGIVLSVFFGAGVVLLSVIQEMDTGAAGGLHHFIYGQTAALSYNDVVLSLVIAVLTIVTTILFVKEFKLVCFDPGFARVQGWPAHFLDVLMMASVVLVTVTGLQSVGLILIIALLIVPATSARFWTESLSKMIFISGIFGALSGYIGATISALLPRLPAGALIVLCTGVFFLLSLFFAPCRGILANTIRQYLLRRKIARDVYE